jgi:phosphoribosylaminoimidazolecarboxamide formyltransferase/IMP cyclohydrolase
MNPSGRPSATENASQARLAVRAALLSLSDRSGAEVLTHALVEHGATVYATTGTASFLSGLGLPVEPAERLTKTSEFLGGRVKTLSSDLFGAILARADHVEDQRDLAARGLPFLDLVAVNLYPFEALPTNASWDEAVEQIDIGGVSLLRAGAKNFARVAVIQSPAQYPEAVQEIEAGGTRLDTRRRWARSTFERVAEYDAAIASFFGERDGTGLPDIWIRAYRKTRGLRYGENPHQEAALYTQSGRVPWWREGAILEGKELSFNNLVDLESGSRTVYEFARPACVVIKHDEPSGVGLGEGSLAAYRRAVAGDSLSAFGGVVAFNCEVDSETAREMTTQFLECVGAPSYAPAAREVFAKRKNLRVVAIAREALQSGPWEVRALSRGALVQRVREDAGEIQLQVVTRRAPTPDEMEALHFAWTVAARCHSNAVVVARPEATVGVGSGQTSRIDALTMALLKARRSGHDVRGAVLASDGFFPFADWVEIARDAGITACIQPGGSVRDAESIAACDDANLAMVFTARRQFRH